jgi:uncharacterized membrane protein HdeD (DUF308 family)
MTTSHVERTESISFPWWLVMLEGIFAALFGLLLLLAPGATLLFLVQVLGFYLLIGGIVRIVSIFIDSSSWIWKLTAGIIGILAGIVVLQHPLWATALVPAVYIIILGIQGLILGGATLVTAFQGEGWGVGILGGLSIVFGLVLLFNVWIGVAALPFVLGAFGIVGGIFAVVMAFRMRSAGSAGIRDSGTEGGEARPA